MGVSERQPRPHADALPGHMRDFALLQRSENEELTHIYCMNHRKRMEQTNRVRRGTDKLLSLFCGVISDQ